MSFVTDFCYRLCRSLSVRLHAQCSYTACRVTNSPISISGISSGCIADTALAPRYDKCHTGIGLLPATVYTTAAVWTRASVWAVHSCRHAVHHAHAPNQGDHDYFEGRLPRRHPNPPFHATNSKPGPSVAELQPQTTVGHLNLPQRSDFRVIDEMLNHAYHAHAQPPLAQSSDHAVPEYNIVEPRVAGAPALKKPCGQKSFGRRRT